MTCQRDKSACMKILLQCASKIKTALKIELVYALALGQSIDCIILLCAFLCMLNSEAGINEF